jgi:hypothetical protein
MTQQIQVMPFLSKLVVGVIGLVVVYLLATGGYNSVNHPLVPKPKLLAELEAIQVPDGSMQIGNISFIDRQTFYYATKSYSSSKSVADITNTYVSLFKKNGWRYMHAYVPGDNASEFCKGELLATLSFPGGAAEPIYYSIQVTTGGTETKTCN